MLDFFKQVINSFIDVLFPEYCISCGRPLRRDEDYLCLDCWLDMPLSYIKQSKDNFVVRKFWGRLPVEAGFSYIIFTKHSGVQSILHAIKYDKASDLAVQLGKIIGVYLRDKTDFPEFDILLPVPLHWKKLRIRGYNQAEEIAKGIAEILPAKIETTAVERTVFNPTQTKKNREERWQNVQNIFSVKKHRALDGKHIVLVDDVLTTGATLESLASEILKSTHGVKISIITLAVAK